MEILYGVTLDNFLINLKWFCLYNCIAVTNNISPLPPILQRLQQCFKSFYLWAVGMKSQISIMPYLSRCTLFYAAAY